MFIIIIVLLSINNNWECYVSHCLFPIILHICGKSSASAFIHSSFSNNGRSHAEGPSVMFVHLQTQ